MNSDRHVVDPPSSAEFRRVPPSSAEFRRVPPTACVAGALPSPRVSSYIILAPAIRRPVTLVACKPAALSLPYLVYFLKL